MGFYSLGVTVKDGEQPEASLCVIDKGSDFSRSHLWTFTRQTLMSFDHQVEELARQWSECQSAGIWPHCDTRSEEGKKVCWSSEYWSICPICCQMPPTIL
jgi:predicted NAD/FAD-dependent oxidoreductase